MPASIFSRTKSLTAAAITLFFLLIPHPSFAADWYVSATLGSDTTGSGSMAAPYRSISKAVQTSDYYDRVLVAEGTYFESVTLDKTLTLLGGHDPLFLERMPSVHRTVIDGGGTAESIFIGNYYVDLTIDGFVIQNAGIGIYLSDCLQVTIQNNLIRNNIQAGIYAHVREWGNYTLLSTSNNLIINNGVGIQTDTYAVSNFSYCFLSHCDIHSVNDTISDNHRGIEMSATCGEICCGDNDSNIRSGIIWGNSLNNFIGGTQVYNYSDIQGGAAGTGNLNADPMFFDFTQTDHQLQPGSPAIDAGDPAPSYNDPDGSRNDMGFTGGPNSAWSDRDHDGMADAWETYYGLNPLDPADGMLDQDTDGVLNRMEFWEGTVPVPMPLPDQDADGTPDTIDCDSSNPNTWSTCATCYDNDGDSYYGICNRYIGINGPDCDDTNVNTWNSCLTCRDLDGDSWFGVCNQYVGINGPDCDDNNSYAWDTCATCQDLDSDGWFQACNQYSGPSATTGAGTGNWGLPFKNTSYDARTQSIYLASEIGSEGTITAAALDVTTIPGQTLNNFTIRMKHTSLAAFSTNSLDAPGSGWTTVYQNNEPRGATGWRTFAFSTPFVYNGTDNLMVDISFNNSTKTSNGFVHFSAASSVRTVFAFADNTYGDPLTWTGNANPTPSLTTNLPNLRVTFSIFGPDCDDSIATGAPCHDTCSIFYQDQDNDTFGDPASSSAICSLPSGYVEDDTDCGPENASVFPGALEVCDLVDNQCPGDAGYGTIDEGCVPVDSDGDGLLDSEEVAAGTNPLLWDTDGDGLSDYLEHNTAGLDPLNSSDALADFDFDQNLNLHEIYNGTGPNDPDPEGHFISTELGCCYFADADGDGILGPNDIAGLENDILGLGGDYSEVIPPTGLTMDADGDGGIGPGDLSEANNMLLGLPLPYIGGRANSLVVLDSPAGPVAAGDTCRVTIGVRNQADSGYAQGFAVIFEVVSGDATLMGGDGSASAAAPGNRYDFSGPAGSSSIVVRPNATGTITIDAYIPACGTPGIGRSCAEINLAAPVSITVP